MLIPPGMADDEAASQYARWLATPPRARDPKTIEQLALTLDTSIAHLHVLHNSPWWEDFVESLCGTWRPGFSLATTHTVLEALAEKAMRGDVAAVTLYLKMAGIVPWTPRTGKILDAEDDSKERLLGTGDDELDALERQLAPGDG